MKILLKSSLAILLLGQAAFAQKDKLPPLYVIKGDSAVRGYGVNATSKSIRFKEKLNALKSIDRKLSQVQVYFLQPPEFTEAMLLFQSRNYKAAREKFAVCVKAYKNFDEVPGNYSSLAHFYEMECARKMNDLEGLASMMSKFIADPILNPDHKLQLEINGVFWDAVQNKAWTRLLSVANDPKWFERKLPGSIRAQVAYCTGLCYEGTNEPIKALTAYNTAFTADFAASEIISKKAALACLRILKNHEATQLAISLFGTDDYNEQLEGAFYLKEGKAIVNLWDKTLGAGSKLPADYLMFKKYGK